MLSSLIIWYFLPIALIICVIVFAVWIGWNQHISMDCYDIASQIEKSSKIDYDVAYKECMKQNGQIILPSMPQIPRTQYPHYNDTSVWSD